MSDRPLEGCMIAIAAPDGSSAGARIEAILRAGAEARACTGGQDLWALLSEASFDLIVVLPERDDVAAVTVYDQLREDPRTSSLPMLLVTNTTVGVKARAATVLSPEVPDEAFVAAVSDLWLPRRKLREAEQQERLLREQLRVELVREEQRATGLADLAHELRSMLGVIFGFSANLRDELPGPLSPDQKTHVEGIMEAVERAVKLLERARSGPALSPRPVSIAPTSAPPRAQRTLVHLARSANEVVALFEALAARKGLRLHCYADDSVCVWADSLKLKQVLTNLMMNAVKYTPAGGAITVKVVWTSPSGVGGVEARRSAEIIVADTGPGIAPEYRERIFARGFRVPEHAALPGEGIGLSVVKEIVAQHGGSIRVEGEFGHGAIFRVLLPQDRRQRARDEGASA